MMARGKTRKKKLDDLPSQTDPRAPLDAAAFLVAAQPVLKLIDSDLLARAKASPAVTEALKTRHKAEKEAKRTADGFAQWQERFVGQVGAAWLLSCVFVRTLEDRGLARQNRLAGEGAADSQRLFFEMAPSLTERDYLLTVFRELARFPAARDLFDTKHNPVWLLAPSAEAAKQLLALFRTPTVDAPAFRFGQEDTRFLGDLYQDLDEGVRKRFALLQTPRFIESFILDRTLEPAIEKFGLDDTTVIDPTCGSGHFLLGSFERIFDHRQRKEPGLGVREAAGKALDAVYGADINPYAVAIARFRLTLAFLDKAGFAELAGAPSPPLHLVVADSLLHNPHVAQTAFGDMEGQSAREWKGEEFALEDEQAARDVLHKKYAAVVGNPPYITVKDKVLRDRYRELYRSCYREYSVAVPFVERFFQLGRDRARVGMITANSFMKREFGKKLIEEYLPHVNLDIIVNTSGAYIPGHGTPTVLLFGSVERPVGGDVVTTLANRGEPSTPSDPERGLVWRSIMLHWNDCGYENEYISVAKLDRSVLNTHPWALTGGGASELKAALESRADARLADVVEEIGYVCITRADDIYFVPRDALRRAGISEEHVIETVEGEVVRDWAISTPNTTLFPYDADTLHPTKDRAVHRFLWPYRTMLWLRREPNGNHREIGLTWWEWSRFQRGRFQAEWRIAFAFVATHNHFVLDRRGRAFKQTAPIIKLPDTATEDDHLALLAYLNSSTACFWMKQVCFPKGGSGIGRGIQDEEWESRFEFDGTKMGAVPLPPDWRSLAPLGRALSTADPMVEFDRMVMLQETLDWTVYRLFGLLPDEPVLTLDDTTLRVGRRPFELRLAAHEPGTAWFERNGYDRPDPAAASGHITSARLAAIDATKVLSLIEQPQFKRRWTLPPTPAAVETERIRTELLAAVEQSLADAGVPTSSGLANGGAVHGTPVSGAELAALIADDAVPFANAYRFTRAGLTKHDAWKRTWEAQRDEDKGERRTSIAVPPKYDKNDYAHPNYWRLRGKLDVPKERFISYPGCESDEDGEPVYGWAGWNHEQRAKALAILYWHRKTEEAWPTERLIPMLAGLEELLFWLELWHDEPSDDYGGDTAANYYAGFLRAELQAHALTVDDLREWRPAEPTSRARRKPTGRAEASAEAEE